MGFVHTDTVKFKDTVCMDAPLGDNIYYIQSCSSSTGITGTILQFASLKYTATVL